MRIFGRYKLTADSAWNSYEASVHPPEYDFGETMMIFLSRLTADIARMKSPRFRRRLKRRLVQYFNRLHDRTAILREMHRTK
jgi:hypothetical protein